MKRLILGIVTTATLLFPASSFAWTPTDLSLSCGQVDVQVPLAGTYNYSVTGLPNGSFTTTMSPEWVTIGGVYGEGIKTARVWYGTESGTSVSYLFVNCTLPVGPTGPTGPRGPVGPRGLRGVDGLTGPQGPKGFRGATGPTGATGPAGVIGATGAQGTAGARGETGPIGLTGATGATGATGHKGPQGHRGPRGYRGPQGVTGSCITEPPEPGRG